MVALPVGRAPDLSSRISPMVPIVSSHVGSQQDVTMGGVLLFAFSLGMGILLILVGTFSGLLAALPKSGQWMVTIKKVLGITMLIIGEYFLIQAGRAEPPGGLRHELYCQRG